jgi:serpin B
MSARLRLTSPSPFLIAAPRALLLFSLLASVPACSGTSSGNPADPGGGSGGFDVPEGAQLVRSELAREEDPALSEADAETFGAGNRDFAFALHAELAGAEPADNVFFSPFSISTALAMTYAGAEGETEQEMREALHFELPEPTLHEAFNATDRALDARASDLFPESEGQGFELSVVNQAWGLTGYEFEAPFLDVLGLHYGAGMLLVDLAAPPTRVLINDWVAEQTQDRVKDLLPDGSLTVDTRFVLTNAIYFKANWLNQFDPSQTVDATFTAAAGERAVKMMHQRFAFQYGEGAGYRAVELPYLSPAVRMLLILPEGEVDALIADLDGAAFDALRAGLSEYDVTLDLPRFSFEAERQLKEPLKALGMPLAFGDADFTAINGGREALYIDEVYHKAFVAVDEEGTEAAAATAVVGVAESAKPTAEIRFDRPFVFVIYDRPTGQILFLGTLRDPG